MDPVTAGFYGNNIYEKWHCLFPFEKLSIENYSQEIMISEPRIEQLCKRINLEGKSVLELGCLEGLHSLILQSLGAREIVAIEGRKENFLKCLVVKNAFNLDKCKFLYGDVSKILGSFLDHFDLCLALGIFYHLKDPIAIIYRIAELADNLFVWTHYSTEHYPKGRLAEVRYQNNIYRGKYTGEDVKHYLSGLQGKSFWISEEDILKVIKDAGFKNIEVIQRENHEHGPAITFLAQK